MTSTPDANGGVTLELSYANAQPSTTVSGTTIDPSQVAYAGDGVFTFGSSQPDASGYTDQLSLAATASFGGISSLNVTDPTTGQTSSVGLDNGSTTDLQEGRSVATGAPNEQVQSTDSDGSQSDIIFGQGAQANVSNTAVTLAPGAQAAVVGYNDKVSDDDSAPVQEGRSVAIDGNNNTDQGGAGDNVELNGAGNAASNVTFGTLTVDAGSTGTVLTNVSYDTISLAQNTSTSASGTGDIFGLAPGAGDFLALAGSDSSVTGDSGSNQVDLTGADTSATVYGGGTVVLTANDLGLTLADGGETVAVNPDLQSEAINGSGLTVNYGGGASGNIEGDNNLVALAPGSGDDVGVIETGNIGSTVTGDTAGNSVNVAGDDGSFTVDGGGYVGILSSGDSLTLGNQGSFVETAPDISNIAVTGTDYEINPSIGVTGDFSGSNATVNLVGNGDDQIGLSGTNQTVTGDSGNNTISFVSGGASGTVYGSGDVALLSSDQSVTLAYGGATLSTAQNVTNETITASGDTISVATGVTATIKGSDDVSVLGSNSTTTIVDASSVIGTGFISETPGETGNVINVDTYGETVSASNAIINVAAGDFVSIAGADDLINMVSNSGSWAYVDGTFDTVDSTGNQVTELGTNSVLTEIGGDNTTYISGDNDSSTAVGGIASLSATEQVAALLGLDLPGAFIEELLLQRERAEIQARDDTILDMLATSTGVEERGASQSAADRLADLLGLSLPVDWIEGLSRQPQKADVRRRAETLFEVLAEPTLVRENGLVSESSTTELADLLGLDLPGEVIERLLRQRELAEVQALAERLLGALTKSMAVRESDTVGVSPADELAGLLGIDLPGEAIKKMLRQKKRAEVEQPVETLRDERNAGPSRSGVDPETALHDRAAETVPDPQDNASLTRQDPAAALSPRAETKHPAAVPPVATPPETSMAGTPPPPPRMDKGAPPRVHEGSSTAVARISPLGSPRIISDGAVNGTFNGWRLARHRRSPEAPDPREGSGTPTRALPWWAGWIGVSHRRTPKETDPSCQAARRAPPRTAARGRSLRRIRHFPEPTRHDRPRTIVKRSSLAATLTPTCATRPRCSANYGTNGA